MTSEIIKFYRDESVFITGATGFMGKVLVEKLLRSCGEVKHIYVLIRSKKGQNVKTRLNDMLKTEIFKKLLECEPKSIDKVVAIEGDITTPGLGISEDDLKLLIRDVSIVFHSAATLKFDEPLRTAINHNVFGTQRVAELCRKLPRLLALIHVSTAYSNCNRQEIDEIVYPSPVPPQSVIDLLDDKMFNDITPQLLDGYPNTYTYTKGLTESMLYQECQDLPIAIMRPSIVAPTWSEPLPGWVDNPNGLTGYLVAVGKGVVRQGFGDEKCRADLIPVDTAINFMITLGWFTATHRPNGIQVYNCTSGALNPISWGKIGEKLKTPYSIKYPSSQIFRYPGFTATNSEFVYKICSFIKHTIPAYIFDTIMAIRGRKRFMVGVYQKINHSYDMLRWFVAKEFHFSNNNLLMVNLALNEMDKMTFNLDIRALDWDDYWDNYWLGIRQFYLKEDNSTLSNARKNLNKIYLRDISVSFMTYSILSLLFYLVYKIFRFKIRLFS